MANSTEDPAVGRLVPGPTGALHLGNARTLLLCWLSIRHRAGTLRLRVEDIDGPRVKKGAEAAALDERARPFSSPGPILPASRPIPRWPASGEARSVATA